MIEDEAFITITKLEAAQRQFRTAVQLWFHDGDPVAIHSLLAACYEIMRAMMKREGIQDILFDTDVVKDEHRDQWTKLVKKSANFFKHADRDPDDTIKFHPYTNEFFISNCVNAFQALGLSDGVEGRAFIFWTIANRPEMLKKDQKQFLAPELAEAIRRTDKALFLEGFQLYEAGGTL